MPAAFARGLTAIVLVGLAVPVRAQSLDYTAGTSSILGVSGGTVTFRTGGAVAHLGLAFRPASGNRPGLGAALEFPFGATRVTVGDHVHTLSLPTDGSRVGSLLPVRGVTATAGSDGRRLVGFVGMNTTTRSTAFTREARPGSPAAALQVERRWGAHWSASSQTFLARRRTSVFGVEWSTEHGLRGAVSAGWKADAPYGAASLVLVARGLTLRARRSGSRGGARVPEGAEPLQLESEQERLGVDLAPGGPFQISLDHRRLSPPQGSAGGLRTMRGVRVGGRIAGFRPTASWSWSGGRPAIVRGRSMGLQHASRHGFELGATWYRSDIAGRSDETLTLRARLPVSPRMSTIQWATRSRGRTTLAWGGELYFSQATVRLDHQMTFDPDPPPGGSAYRRSLMVSAEWALPGFGRVHVETHADENGRTGYTARSGGHLLGRPTAAVELRGPAHRLAASHVAGIVVDSLGAPLEGIALRVGEALVFTDRQGRFDAPTEGGRARPFRVALEDDLYPGDYEVVSAPTDVRPTRGSAGVVRVVLRRIRRAPIRGE